MSKTIIRQTAGFTLPELIVSMVIMGILSLIMVASVVGWLSQYAVGSTRQTRTADLQASIARLSDDIRQSYGILQTNAATDPNAPASKWTSSSNQIVLAKTPRNASGTGLYADATTYLGLPDSIVYYLRDNTLYRRTVPANYTGNVTLPILTCTPITGGGCPSDIKVASGVSSLTYTYLDEDGNVTTNPIETRAVTVALQLSSQQSGQTVTVSNSTTVAFRLIGNYSSTTDAPFAVGPGGVTLNNGGEIRTGSTQKDVYVKGKITFSITQAIGTSSQRFKNIYVANQACGTNYTSTCSSEPISLGTNGLVYADKVCAAGQTTTATAFGVLQTLDNTCTAPILELPLFNKAAHAAKMTSTVSSPVVCNTNPSCNVSLPANTRYNTSIGGGSYRLNLTLNGDLYVTGNFGNKAASGSLLSATITVAEGVTTRPVIVVNGKIGFDWMTINANSAGISPIFISFYSSDTASSASDSYNDATPALIYNSLQQSGHAIDLDGPGTLTGSFYGYYDSVYLRDQVQVNGNIAGQRVELDNGLVRINLTDDLWPS